jgi:hypothetical protein
MEIWIWEFLQMPRPTDVRGIEEIELWGGANDVTDENKPAPE